jgi:hypothetical protein
MRRLVPIIFILGLTAPGLAFMLGNRADSFENRSPPPLPGLSVASIRSVSYFEEMNDFLVYYLPLRRLAVNAIRTILFVFWRDMATEEVVVGRDDFLFLRNTFDRWCGRKSIRFSSVRAAETLRDISSNGPRVIWVSVPDKFQFYSHLLPQRFAPAAECSKRRRAVFSKAMKDGLNGDYIDLLPIVEALSSEMLVYHKNDTHWKSAAAALLPQSVIELLQERLWNEQSIRLDEKQTRNADLAIKLGVEIPHQTERMISKRNGVKIDSRELIEVSGQRAIRMFKHKGGPDARLIPGRTVLIHDSYALPVEKVLAPYFEEIVMIHWSDLKPGSFGEYARDANLIIAQSVDRLAVSRQRMKVNRWWRRALEQSESMHSD